MYFESETGNKYFDLEVFVHSFEILKGSLQIVIDHIFRGSFVLTLIYILKSCMPYIKGEYKC